MTCPFCHILQSAQGPPEPKSEFTVSATPHPVCYLIAFCSFYFGAMTFLKLSTVLVKHLKFWEARFTSANIGQILTDSVLNILSACVPWSGHQNLSISRSGDDNDEDHN